MTPETQQICPECGQPFPKESQHSVCRACLMAQAIASRTINTVHSDSDNKSTPPPIPAPEDIADKFPNFEITECLGRGGMGIVYKARQKALDRWVAIKILAPEREREPDFAERFAREAQTLARMNHPNIVTVFDYGEADGMFFIVMEYVDGVNLRDLLREGKMEPQQALAIVPPICEALQYAHDKEVVHRDIKPENLLLDREGKVKIADFGIASLAGASGERSGTPPYMPPEQKAGSADERADIFSLGVVLYEMLTGERPQEDLVAPSKKVEVDVRIDEMVLRALEKEPEKRYQTAAEFQTVVNTISNSTLPPTRNNFAQNSKEPKLDPDSRFSRSALVGAYWAGFFFLAVLFFFSQGEIKVSSSEQPSSPSWWQQILLFTVLSLGIAAPFGTTILGWVAVSKIRHSKNKLRGLGLAVFDGLLFPLLLLNAVIFVLIKALLSPPFLHLGASEKLLLTSISGLTIVGIVDYLLIRKTWRALTQYSTNQNSPKNPKQNFQWGLGLFIGAILFCAIAGPSLLKSNLNHRTDPAIPEALASNATAPHPLAESPLDFYTEALVSHTIASHLQAQSLRWDRMWFEPNTSSPSDVIVRFEKLRRIGQFHETLAVKPLNGFLNLHIRDGTLDMGLATVTHHALDNTLWQVTGLEDLAGIQFQFPLQPSHYELEKPSFESTASLSELEWAVFLGDFRRIHDAWQVTGRAGETVPNRQPSFLIIDTQRGQIELVNAEDSSVISQRLNLPQGFQYQINYYHNTETPRALNSPVTLQMTPPVDGDAFAYYPEFITLTAESGRDSFSLGIDKAGVTGSHPAADNISINFRPSDIGAESILVEGYSAPATAEDQAYGEEGHAAPAIDTRLSDTRLRLVIIPLFLVGGLILLGVILLIYWIFRTQSRKNVVAETRAAESENQVPSTQTLPGHIWFHLVALNGAYLLFAVGSVWLGRFLRSVEFHAGDSRKSITDLAASVLQGPIPPLAALAIIVCLSLVFIKLRRTASKRSLWLLAVLFGAPIWMTALLGASCVLLAGGFSLPLFAIALGLLWLSLAWLGAGFFSLRKQSESTSRAAWWSAGTAGGVVLIILLHLLAQPTKHTADIAVFIVYILLSLASISCGIASWKTRLGRGMVLGWGTLAFIATLVTMPLYVFAQERADQARDAAHSELLEKRAQSRIDSHAQQLATISSRAQTSTERDLATWAEKTGTYYTNLGGKEVVWEILRTGDQFYWRPHPEDFTSKAIPLTLLQGALVCEDPGEKFRFSLTESGALLFQGWRKDNNELHQEFILERRILLDSPAPRNPSPSPPSPPTRISINIAGLVVLGLLITYTICFILWIKKAPYNASRLSFWALGITLSTPLSLLLLLVNGIPIWLVGVLFGSMISLAIGLSIASWKTKLGRTLIGFLPLVLLAVSSLIMTSEDTSSALPNEQQKLPTTISTN